MVVQALPYTLTDAEMDEVLNPDTKPRRLAQIVADARKRSAEQKAKAK